ncbi:ultraviolet-B receptor UVR8 [Lactuca sativa]|uniref:ultraviolet-B receptor UVR8 n=1 Tax=Lactuca sativa TaxID=4236 RepID=UPI000CD88951|nr:ultraviolet-B receptor UVR8 [Lactuca sativa]
MTDAGIYVDSGSLSRKVIAIAAGEAHTLALTGDGSVYSWGRGTFGRLGSGSELDRLFPAKIEFNSTEKVKIVQVSAGSYHSLALSDDGSVWSWGHNTYGQLGVNGENSLVPSLVQVFNELHPPSSLTDELITKTESRLQISSIKAGGMMSLAIDNLGSLWMWGNCPPQDSLTEGEFSLVPTYTPIPVWNFHGQTVVKVACGNEHIVALVSTGETYKGDDNLVCYTWGNNNHGQLGLGDTEIRTTPQIIKTFNQESSYTPYEVACGAFHTSILSKTDGDMLRSVCWSFGLGDHGQLGQPGQGTIKDSLYPEIVEGIPENVWLVSVDCGLFHTSVVSSEGYVWSFGKGNGLGLTESDGGDAVTPRLIPCNGLKYPCFQDPLQVACGAAHTVLLADNGYKLWSWGRGRSGVLGSGQVNDFFAPNLVLWPPLEEDFKESEKLDEKDSFEIIKMKKELNVAMKEIDLLHSKLSTMEHYASILHGMIFGKPFEEEKDILLSLKSSYDVGKEWENMLESCDYGKLVRLEMFYCKMLASVKDKMMNVKIKEMIKECLESSTSVYH